MGNNVDQMIAKQIAHQQNVDNDDGDNEESLDKEKDGKPLDLDYLLALTMEQEDIINSAELFDDGVDNEDDDIESNRNALITDSEIIALLEQPGIDIDALINTYPSLTREYIITLRNKTKSRKYGKHDRSNKKWKKNKRKKRNKMDEVFIDDKDNDDENDDDIENENEDNNDENEDIDQFMKKFKTFNKKSDFIKKQKKQINGNDNDNMDSKSPKKKRRRRRKDKEKQNQRNICLATSSPIKSKCNACNQMFGSKNKLYDHLKQFPKHALKSQH